MLRTRVARAWPRGAAVGGALEVELAVQVEVGAEHIVHYHKANLRKGSVDGWVGCVGGWGERGVGVCDRLYTQKRKASVCALLLQKQAKSVYL